MADCFVHLTLENLKPGCWRSTSLRHRCWFRGWPLVVADNAEDCNGCEQRCKQQRNLQATPRSTPRSTTRIVMVVNADPCKRRECDGLLMRMSSLRIVTDDNN